MSASVLDYSDIYQEIRGALHEGRLRLNNNNVVFKNIKTGKVETIPLSDIESVVWRRVARGYELKLELTDGRSCKYDGFKEAEFEKINKHVKNNYNVTIEQQDMSAKGWNWGDTTFNGYELQFDVDSKRAFEIPLQNVSQCTPGKNEVSLEFHQNDDAELSLMEMRFFVPPSQNDETDTVQVFSDNVISKADVLQAKGNAICTFQDLQCLTPRGRYDIRMYPKFVQLHGKTFDYKITYTSILRLFLLPHRDQRQIFFVVSLDPPVRQGQTRYHFLVLLFYKEDEMSVEMTLSEREIEEKFGDRLQKDMSGPIYEVVSRVMKNLVQRKITVPGSFKGPNSDQSIMCTYKASSGFLFPLERGFMYVHKPPIHVRFDEIAFVNFARGSATSSRSFDFEIETRSQTAYVFSNIEKNCYPALFDFVSQKKLKIKNIGKGVDGGGNIDIMANSDSEDEQHDAYLERMKQEAADRDEDDGGGDSDEGSEEDEDFNPGAEPDEVADEYDSDVRNTSSDENDEKGSDNDEEEKKPKKKKKEKSATKRSSSKKEGKKKKDPNAPKRPSSAYMQWLSDNRSKIKKENPELSMTEIAKHAGKLWKDVSDAEKKSYNEKYEKDKIRYKEEMKKYEAAGGSRHISPIKKQKKSSPKGSSKTLKSPKKSQPGGFKSKEFIQDSGSSSSDSDNDKPKAKIAKKESSPEPQASGSEEESAQESEAESTPASSEQDSD
uniref:FACT complex subunit SSRP1-like n=1 Tax=Styela clava TaxID=7725 RepID=UPI0019397B9B|nr:FACT complex subunit SSRP1-like [Styela clava]